MQNRLVLIFGLAIFVLVPSFDAAYKYLGLAGLVVYFLAGVAGLFLIDKFAMPWLRTNLSTRSAIFLTIATIVGLIAITFTVYPIANSGRFGGGSDADDALLIAAGELIKGNYPYLLKTYLGNTISPMPGTVLLAVPFVVLGLLPLQNIVWLAILFFVYKYYQRSSTTALGLLWVMLVLSPTLMQSLVTGADYASNTIYLLVSMWVLVRGTGQQETDRISFDWPRVLAAIFLGIGLSSRSTFALIMPVFISALVQNLGWKRSFQYLFVAGLVSLAVTLPFWIASPGEFAPLAVQGGKLRSLEETLPYATLLIPGSAAVLSISLSFQKMRDDLPRFFRNCGIVQLFVLCLTSVVYSLHLGRLDLYLGQLGYGMFSLFFGATAYWMYLNNDVETDRKQFA